MIHRLKHLLVVLVCLALLVSALSCSPSLEGQEGLVSGPTAPQPPAWMELQMPKAPRVGEDVELTCTMRSAFDLPGEALIEFEIADREHSYRGMSKMPPDEVLVSGNLNWKGTLMGGFETSYSRIIAFPYEGEWKVSGRFDIDDDWVNPYEWSSPGGLGDSIKLHITKHSGRFGWPRDYQPMRARRVPSESYPLTRKLDVSKAPRLGESTELTCSMNSIRDVTQAEAEIEFYRMKGTERVEIPAEDILFEGDLSWDGALEKDISVQFSAIIKFPEEGDWGMKASGSSPEDVGGCGHSLFLNISKDKGRFGWVQPHEKGVRPEPPHPYQLQRGIQWLWDILCTIKKTAHAPTVEAKAPDKVAVGMDFIIGVFIADVADLQSYRFDLAYDPNAIEVIETECDTVGGPSGSVDSTIVFSVPGEPGTVRVDGNIPGGASITGSGYLAEVPFHAISSFSNTAVSLSNGTLLNNRGRRVARLTWLGDSMHITPRITVSMDVPQQAAGDSDFTARVNVTEVRNLDAFQVDITYDPEVIEVTDISAGLIDSTNIPAGWGFMPPGERGTVRVLGRVPGIAGVTGSGYLAEIHFHVLGLPGSTSNITLSNGRLGDNMTEKILVTEWLGDSVHVT